METRQRIISSQNPIFGAGVTTFPTFTRTLSITQPVFRKDVIERMGQAKAVVKQAEFTLLAAEQELLLRTTAAYLVLLAANDSVMLATAERETVGKALDLARERLRAGLGTITNQYDAQARYAVTQAREIEAQNRLRDARQAMREITGKAFDKVQSLREDFKLESPQPAAVERWLETALAQNLGNLGTALAVGGFAVAPAARTALLVAASCYGLYIVAVTILGKNQVNIADMSLARDKQSATALTILTLDTAPSADVIAELEKIEGIKRIHCVAVA